MSLTKSLSIKTRFVLVLSLLAISQVAFPLNISSFTGGTVLVNNPTFFTYQLDDIVPTCASGNNRHNVNCVYRITSEKYEFFNSSNNEIFEIIPPTVSFPDVTGQSRSTLITPERTGIFYVKLTITFVTFTTFNVDSPDGPVSTVTSSSTTINSPSNATFVVKMHSLSISPCSNNVLQNHPCSTTIALQAGKHSNYTVTWTRNGGTAQEVETRDVNTTSNASASLFLPSQPQNTYLIPKQYSITCRIVDKNVPTSYNNELTVTVPFNVSEYASDLWMRDNPWNSANNPGDIGVEPNNYASHPHWWNVTHSPDLIFRARNDFYDQFHSYGIFSPTSGSSLSPFGLNDNQRDWFNGDQYNSSPYFDFNKNGLNTYYTYALVRNRGNRHSNSGSSNDNHLRVFWTIARTNEVWTDHWLYGGKYGNTNFTSNGYPLGSEMTINSWNVQPYANINSAPVSIPSINSKSDPIYPNANQADYQMLGPIPFAVPDPRNYINDIQFDNTQLGFCIQARIEEHKKLTKVGNIWREQNGMAIQESVANPTDPNNSDNLQIDKFLVKDLVTQNNNIVTRNSYVASNIAEWKDENQPLTQSCAILVNNPSTDYKDITLRIQSTDENSFSTFPGDIYIIFDDALFNIWTNSGSNVSGAVLYSHGTFKLTSDVAIFPSLHFSGNEEHFAGMKFNFYQNIEGDPSTYEFIMGEWDNDNQQYTGSPFQFVAKVNHEITPDQEYNEDEGYYKTSIKQNAASEIKVYPNPANKQLSIFIPSSIQCDEIAICDILGKELKSIKINESKDLLNIDLDEIPEGLYFIKIINSGKQIGQDKLIINR